MNALQVLTGALQGENAPKSLKSISFSYKPVKAIYFASKKKQALMNNELQDKLRDAVHDNKTLRVIKNYSSPYVFVDNDHLMLQRALNYNSTMYRFDFSGNALPDEVFEDSIFANLACMDDDAVPNCRRVSLWSAFEL